MQEVPAVMYEYENDKEKVDHFFDLDTNRKTGPRDVLKMSKQSYSVLYRYLLHNDSSYISSNNDFSTKATNVHRIISYAGLGSTYVFTIRRQTGMDALSEKANKELVLIKVNRYIDWLVTVFANYHINEKKKMMKVRNFEALSHFYLLLKNQGLEKKAISKMSRFYDNPIYLRFLEAGLISNKIEILVSVFNKGRNNYILSTDLKARAGTY